MQLKRFILVSFLFVSHWLIAQPKVDILEYIDTYKDFAISEMHRTGVPASIKLAQGIHETFAGKSVLVLKSNNHFGIKCKDTWTGGKVYHDDDARGECFRSYSSPLDSYQDHSNFLRSGSRYSFLFQLDPTDYKAWAYGLKRAGYATNNKYSQIIIGLIEEYDLQKYSLLALGKLSPNDERFVKDWNQVDPVIRIQGIVEELPPPVEYPYRQFLLNNTRVIFAKAGTSLLFLAEQYQLPLGRLLDFNDLKKEEVLTMDQLVFLQRKRKAGANEFHIVQNGESLYGVSQAEGIRLESLGHYNRLQHWEEPAIGEILYLKEKAPSKPKLRNEALGLTTLVNEENSSSIKTHIVQTKETLYSIARKYGVNVGKIIEWNNLAAAGVKTGQQLVIYKN